MKKSYDSPSAELAYLKRSSFLEASSDQTAIDVFNDEWANQLGAPPSV